MKNTMLDAIRMKRGENAKGYIEDNSKPTDEVESQDVPMNDEGKTDLSEFIKGLSPDEKDHLRVLLMNPDDPDQGDIGKADDYSDEKLEEQDTGSPMVSNAERDAVKEAAGQDLSKDEYGDMVDSRFMQDEFDPSSYKPSGLKGRMQMVFRKKAKG